MSNSQWLPDLPDGWRVARLQHLATTATSNVDKHSIAGQTPVRLCNYVDVYKNASIRGDMDFMSATASTEQIARFTLRRGDVVITKDSETADDIGIPAFVDHEVPDLLCGYHLSIVRPLQGTTHPRYLYWALASRATLNQWSVLATGVTRVGLKTGDIARLQVPLPPFAEQRAIADYLDRETAQIDTLIEEQQRLLLLIAEKRRGLIADRLARFEGSMRLRHLGDFASGAGFPPSLQSQRGHELSFFKVRNLATMDEEGYLKPADDTIDRATATELRAAVFPHGTLVIAKIGAALLLGRIGILRAPSCLDNNMLGFIPWDRDDSTFLRLALSTAPFDLFANPGAVPSMNVRALRDWRSPWATSEERREFVEEVRQGFQLLRRLEESTLMSISLSHERRAALITAAVTGQIDVGASA